MFANTREVDRGPGRTPCGWTQVDSRRSTTVRTGMWSREHRHAPLRTRLHQVCPDGCARSHSHTPQPARIAETCVAGFWGRGTAAPPPAAAAPPASRGQPERAALARGGSGHPALLPAPVPTTTRGPSMAFGQRASWPPGVRAREVDVRDVEARGRLCARCPGTDPDTPGLLATGPWTCDGGRTVLDRAELRRGIRTRQTTDGWRRGSVTPGVRETRVGTPPQRNADALGETRSRPAEQPGARHSRSRRRQPQRRGCEESAGAAGKSQRLPVRKGGQRLDVRTQRTGRSRGARKRRNKAAKGDRPLPRQWAPRAALGPGAESRPQPAEPADLGPSARMGVLRALESRMTLRKAPARGPARRRG